MARLRRRPRPRVIIALPRHGSLGLPRRAVWIGALGAITILVFLAGTGYAYRPLAPELVEVAAPSASTEPLDERALRREQKRLAAALRALVPSEPYIVVDQTHNRLYLKRGEETLLEAACSSGSGMILRESGTERHWVFDTPRGAFRVRSKVSDPVWRKPDWAFVEAGEPIPSDPGERIEYGTLGEYALYLGDGYMIHGTLYERLLGRSVTHGCIRVGRDDLRRLYRETRVGTPVFIF